MVDANTPPSTKVRAADSVLNHSAKAIEIEDIEVRVAELERNAESAKLSRRNRNAQVEERVKTLSWRIEQLERRTGASTQGEMILFVMQAGAEFALDLGRCVAILSESGFIRTGRGISLLNFLEIPHGLNGEELEQYLRVYGETCNFRQTASPALGSASKSQVIL
jgi:hypothetical protein